MRRIAVLGLGLVTACADDQVDPTVESPEPHSTPDASSAAPFSCWDLDDWTVPDEAPSLVDDVLPIFGLSCTHDSCHRGTPGDGHLRLGQRCDYDDATESCAFDAGVVTDELVVAMRNTLLAPSNQGRVLPRVTPGSPGQSFLVLKLAGCQDEYPDRTGCGSDCGDEMPPNSPFVEVSRERFDVITNWVAAGAPF